MTTNFIKNAGAEAETFMNHAYTEMRNICRIWLAVLNSTSDSQEQLVDKLDEVKHISNKMMLLYNKYMRDINKEISNTFNLKFKRNFKHLYDVEEIVEDCLEVIDQYSNPRSKTMLNVERAVLGGKNSSHEQILSDIYESTNTVREAFDQILDMMEYEWAITRKIVDNRK